MGTEHYVIKFKHMDNHLTLYCQTSPKAYDDITRIIYQGKETHQCHFHCVKKENSLVEYTVTLPCMTTSACSFFIITNSKKKKRVWKPGKGLTVKDLPDHFYFTKFLNLAFSTNKRTTIPENQKQVYSPILREITCTRKNIHIKGCIFLSEGNSDPNKIELHCAKFRQEDIFFRFKAQTKRIYGDVFPGCSSTAIREFNQCVVYTFSCTLPLLEINKNSGSYNIFISHAGMPLPLRQARKGHLKKKYYSLSQISYRSFLGRTLFIPYYDQNYNRWRMDVHHINIWEWVRLRILYRKCSKKPAKKDMNVWLLGEYTTTASDNGMHFFNYMRKEHPEIEAYYVIEKGAQSKGLHDKKNIVHYGSYKHFALSAKAGTLVFSHLPEYLLPKLTTISRFDHSLSAYSTFFLQHGVIAMKNLNSLYGANVRKFNKFFVSSQGEKSIVVSELKYTATDTCVTGLARWDNLHRIKAEENILLFIPTWRKSLENSTRQEFIRSDFYTHWNSLLTHPKLLEIIREKNIIIKFVLHMALNRFTDSFYTDSNILHASNKGLQANIARCSLLATDYSSASFDAIYLNKPVIYFQFDYPSNEYNATTQYIMPEVDLPGPICSSSDMAVHKIIQYIENDFMLENMYRERRNNFFAYTDNHNCNRIFNTIQNTLQKRLT